MDGFFLKEFLAFHLEKFCKQINLNVVTDFLVFTWILLVRGKGNKKSASRTEMGTTTKSQKPRVKKSKEHPIKKKKKSTCNEVTVPHKIPIVHLNLSTKIHFWTIL